jgi:ankyrin repeat protein
MKLPASNLSEILVSSERRLLHWASRNGYEAVVRLLLEKGADIKAEHSIRETALHQAARKRHEAAVQLLSLLTPNSSTV